MARSLRFSFLQHRTNARRRGHEFLLSFDEWLGIWVASGHLSERGPDLDQYVMARNGDKGPYAVGNVSIKLWADNRAEQRCSQQTREKMRRAATGNKNNLGHKASLEHRAKISASLMGNKSRTGMKNSPEEIERQRARAKQLWADPEFRAKMMAARKKAA